MERNNTSLKIGLTFLSLLVAGAFYEGIQANEGDLSEQELMQAQAVMDSMEEDLAPAQYRRPRSKSNEYTGIDAAPIRADSFLAGPEWEFDGFVAGGQDSIVKNMFTVNDLIYLNIGYVHGLETGDRLEVFKRGMKVKDPQTGRFLGYEIRRAAVSLVTDRIEDDFCAVRITNSFEAVEIGDIVRRVE